MNVSEQGTGQVEAPFRRKGVEIFVMKSIILRALGVPLTVIILLNVFHVL